MPQQEEGLYEQWENACGEETFRRVYLEKVIECMGGMEASFTGSFGDIDADVICNGVQGVTDCYPKCACGNPEYADEFEAEMGELGFDQLCKGKNRITCGPRRMSISAAPASGLRAAFFSTVSAAIVATRLVTDRATG
jgi:hypothetical protein